MKKSYDYFKTLKVLSDSVSVVYQKTLLKDDFSSENFQFFAEKSEIINNLKNEFITPFERGDIFLLEEYLTEEYYAVLSLNSFSCLVNFKDYVELKNLEDSFRKKSIIFSQLKSLKSDSKLFKLCSEEIKNLNNEKKNIEKHIINSLKSRNEQAILNYAFYSNVLDLNRKIYKTISEIQRILINNS